MVQGIFLIHVIVFCSCLKFVLTFKECKKIDECSCSTDEGEISLWKLAETGKPRFSNILSNVGAYKFSWNPCNSFSLSQSEECVDVAACLEDTGAHKYYGIAKQTTATCALNQNGECALHYTGKGFIKAPAHFNVILRCNESQEGKVDPVNFQVVTQTSTTVLHSKYACAATPTPSPSGLSLGSILVISFSCFLIVYIICGILINVYIRHVEGKTAFPNYSFWADFPFLIKDGCVFTYQSLAKLCGLGPGRTGYATI